MSDEQYALSPAATQPPPPTEADYEAIFAAVMETVRGRWFLAEFARRNRHADTQTVLAAIERLESMVRNDRDEPADRDEHADPAFERIRTDIRDMADAIAATKREIAAMRKDGEHKGISEATEELDSIVMATERATSDILAAAETIQETAWTLREQGLDEVACDKLDRYATDVYLACSFQDLTGQRTRKVIQVMRYLEGRINAMVDILGEDSRPTDQGARSHSPLDIDMDQAEIDAVIPTTHADRRPAALDLSFSPMDAGVAFAGDADIVVMGDEPAAERPPEPPPAHGEATDALAETAFAPVQPEAMTAADTTQAMLPELDLGFTSMAPAPSETTADIARSAEAAAPIDVTLDIAVGDDFGARNGDLDIAASDAPADEQLQFPAFDGEADRIAAAEALLAATTPTAGNPANAALADDAALLDAESAAWGPSVAPDTKALMDDLLAIIRPPEADSAVGPGFDTGVEQASVVDEQVAPAPRREDFRSMRPIAPGAASSDFVIVPLAIDDNGTAGEDATPDVPVAAAVIPEPVTIAEAEFTPPAEEVTETATAEPAAPVAEVWAPPAALSDSLPDSGDDSIAGEGAIPDEPMAAAEIPEPVTAAAAQFTPPAELPVESTAAPTPRETEVLMPPAALFDSGDAIPAATMELSDLDNDLLMAAEALGPREAPPVDEPASFAAEPAAADVSDLVDLDSDLLMPPEAPAPGPEAAPALESTAEVDVESEVDATSEARAEVLEADILAPTLPAPALDDEALAATDLAVGDAALATEEAHEATELPAAPAPAIALMEEPPANDPDNEVVVLPPVMLGASAAAALVALASSAPLTSEAAAETVAEEITHADPLAAVNALTVEERIALFS